MFKFLALSCLLAVNAQCLPSPNSAVPYYPQPYPATYPQVYAAQPKYNVQPAFVAPYSPASYRQVYVPANPAYNPYYYGYVPYAAYPQQYPYQYVQNDGTQAPAPSGWGEYLNSIWNYVPNYPFGSSESQSTSEAESSGTASNAESSATAEASPGKGDKPTEGQKTEAQKIEQPASNDQTAQAPFKQPYAPAPFVYFGQPQYYGQVPYQQAVYDPSKLNAANNGAVSSFLFSRNQPQPAVYQQPQPFAEQKNYQAYQGTAALAYQRYLQNQKQPIQEQYRQQPNQLFQQDQPAFQSQQQIFQQEQPSFQQQPTSQQQYDRQTQQDPSSVVVDSNSSGVQVNDEGQQKSQTKLATGSN